MSGYLERGKTEIKRKETPAEWKESDLHQIKRNGRKIGHKGRGPFRGKWPFWGLITFFWASRPKLPDSLH